MPGDLVAERADHFRPTQAVAIAQRVTVDIEHPQPRPQGGDLFRRDMLPPGQAAGWRDRNPVIVEAPHQRMPGGAILGDMVVGPHPVIAAVFRHVVGERILAGQLQHLLPMLGRNDWEKVNRAACEATSSDQP